MKDPNDEGESGKTKDGVLQVVGDVVRLEELDADINEKEGPDN